MTRDGTFRIRDGKIAEPLVNLRFTVSVPQMLEDVPGLGREQQLVNSSDFYGERYPIGTLVPAIATARFNITGVGLGAGALASATAGARARSCWWRRAPTRRP